MSTSLGGLRLTAAGAGLLLASALAACSTATTAVAPPPVTAAEVGEFRAGTGVLNGYLDPKQLPDSLALLPPPPAAKSAAFAADLAAYRAAPSEADTARWALASKDADLSYPNVVDSFAAVLGITIDEATTPNLAMLLRRSFTDAGLATYRAKDHYDRVRPYVREGVPTCYPKDEKMGRTDGSYPSGHTSIGWMFGLVLTELVPAKQDALLARAYDFGQSRVVCRYHWQSDVEAGRLVASATFARLQADPVFQAQLELARAEVAAQMAQ